MNLVFVGRLCVSSIGAASSCRPRAQVQGSRGDPTSHRSNGGHPRQAEGTGGRAGQSRAGAASYCGRGRCLSFLFVSLLLFWFCVCLCVCVCRVCVLRGLLCSETCCFVWEASTHVWFWLTVAQARVDLESAESRLAQVGREADFYVHVVGRSLQQEGLIREPTCPTELPTISEDTAEHDDATRAPGSGDGCAPQLAEALKSHYFAFADDFVPTDVALSLRAELQALYRCVQPS